jgi:hypothetical protein
MSTTTATRYEVQVDTEIARIATAIADTERSIRLALLDIERYENADASYRRIFPVIGERAAAAEAALPGLRAQQDALTTDLHIEEAKYTGWNRYYLVNNTNGHLHPDTNCSTCNNGVEPTQFKWITEFSGFPTAEVIELAGEKCCTVCYPGAPVEKKADRAFRSDEEIAREERDAEKAAKRAKKAEKALRVDLEEVVITDPNGRTDERLKTIVAAENYYAGELSWAESVRLHSNEGGRNEALIAEYRYHAEQALQALAARFETTVEAQRERLAPKLARKLKNEGLAG